MKLVSGQNKVDSREQSTDGLILALNSLVVGKLDPFSNF